jgi:phosphatidylinositol 3,5-bisphosphate 5-phosphatase
LELLSNSRVRFTFGFIDKLVLAQPTRPWFIRPKKGERLCVSEQGKVANDVEHEQILHDDSSSAPGTFCSYLQVRGSIPTYWSQESSVTMPKPPIELNRVDPTYTATQLHFEDLMTRYSTPILVLDLVKQSEKREREVRVGNEFRHAIDYINSTIDDVHKIRYWYVKESTVASNVRFTF